jgi:aspartate 1-decarboxylase
MSFLQLDETERTSRLAKVVHVDSANRIVALGSDPAQPVPGAINQMAGA